MNKLLTTLREKSDDETRRRLYPLEAIIVVSTFKTNIKNKPVNEIFCFVNASHERGDEVETDHMSVMLYMRILPTCIRRNS